LVDSTSSCYALICSGDAANGAFVIGRIGFPGEPGFPMASDVSKTERHMVRRTRGAFDRSLRVPATRGHRVPSTQYEASSSEVAWPDAAQTRSLACRLTWAWVRQVAPLERGSRLWLTPTDIQVNPWWRRDHRCAPVLSLLV
jgi:hypothetical protein